ncbi:MAG: L-lactate dehydrogenase [Candidatus Paceibacterota bacterium]
MDNKNSLKQKIAVIGAGAVGSTVAYTLMVKNLASEIILVDINEEKVKGEVMDINDGLSFSETQNVKIGSYKDVADADIIILTAGVAQKPGETRLDLVAKNKSIITSIFKEIGQIKSSTIIIVVSNPVDIIAYLVQEISGLPKNQVFGTGMGLDSARLRSNLAKRFNIESEQVEGFVIGEHGDSEFVAWSTVSIGGKMVKDMLQEEEMNSIEETVKKEAYEIINRKGATYYGIAMVVADVVEAIIFNQNKIIPVSSRLNNWNEVDNICLGTPAVIGNTGVVKLWPIELNPIEKEKLKKSAEIIRQYL